MYLPVLDPIITTSWPSSTNYLPSICHYLPILTTFWTGFLVKFMVQWQVVIQKQVNTIVNDTVKAFTFSFAKLRETFAKNRCMDQNYTVYISACLKWWFQTFSHNCYTVKYMKTLQTVVWTPDKITEIGVAMDIFWHKKKDGRRGSPQCSNSARTSEWQ